ncbi:459_t:CDS:2 [Scutellospora calospora]|uniref:459_t:CDS:1 n=1 Tax=Scutellospora calospora TaxID=85575 RepID=A0ACA9KFQ3_9GLOM|nr:459_t:CDS:2 [Scutellospora calospora]
MTQFYKFKADDIMKKEFLFEKFRGQVILIINVPFGELTPQYEWLQKLLNERMNQGFTIVVFPCDQFGQYEPRNEEVIHEAGFKLFSKIEVNGPYEHPVYNFLKNSIKTDDIKLNFTKFLVDRQGNVVEKYEPRDEPEKIYDGVDKALTKPLWGNMLENRLCELYTKDNVVDIFWGRSVEEHTAGENVWHVYVITRGPFHPRTKLEDIDGILIHFIREDDAFIYAETPPQTPYDPLPSRKKVPENIQKAFDDALNNELGPSFREAHYNLVGMSTGYKRIRRKLTEIPAIILYVRQKGILRRGCEGLFPNEICGFPVDVVEARVATPYRYHGEELCRDYQDEISLGASIGIGITGSRKTIGTLGVVVCERDLPNRIGIVSCEHVLKFKDSEIGSDPIIQPSREDFLDVFERRLRNIVASSKEPGVKKELYKKRIEERQDEVDRAKNKKPLVPFATYERGMRKNYLSGIDGKYYGIDAAFCIFTNKDRYLFPNKFSITRDIFEEAGLPRETRLRGFYTYNMLRNFDKEKVFKVGRTTGLTVGHWIPTNISVAIELTNKSIELAESKTEIPPYVDRGIFVGYMKAQLVEEVNRRRQECYPTIWFDRQLAIQFGYGGFEVGDSGASVVDEDGMALGILHAYIATGNYNNAIASPYFAVCEALDVDFLLTDYPIKPSPA